MGAAKRWAVFMACAFLAACATGDGKDTAERARKALVGLTKPKLLACAGAPARQAVVNGREYLTYSRQPVGYDGGTATERESDALMLDGYGTQSGVGLPAYSIGAPDACDVTFILKGGVVGEVSYPAGANRDACVRLVGPCVPPSP